MTNDPSSLDALMARLAEGDRTVFRQVFQLVWGPVLRLCASYLHNEADASDAAQEAMHKILERASDYDKTRPALPWAMALAAWECRTQLRKRSRRRESYEVPSDQAGPDVEQALLERDVVRAALSALGELSETDRETLLATFWDEAASVSGATLRKRRERAFERLRATFRRLYGVD